MLKPPYIIVDFPLVVLSVFAEHILKLSFFIDVRRPFTFNAVIDMFAFKFIIFLFIIYLFI